MATGTIQGFGEGTTLARIVWTSTPDADNNRTHLTAAVYLARTIYQTRLTSTAYLHIAGTILNTTDGWSGPVDIPADGVYRLVHTFDCGWIQHLQNGTRTGTLELYAVFGSPGWDNIDRHNLWPAGHPSGTVTFDAYGFFNYETFTSQHTITVASGLLLSAKYSVDYTLTGDPLPETPTAHVDIYHGIDGSGNPTELIYSGDVLPDVSIPLGHTVAAGDVITMVVATQRTTTDEAWSAAFYEALDDNTWTFLGYADDQLVGLTANEQIWNGTIGGHVLENAQTIPNPADASGNIAFSDLAVGGADASGNLTISATATPTEPFKVAICHTLLNRFGPTLPSDLLTFYASKPTSEWTTTMFVTVSGSITNDIGIIAVELYYTEGDYQEPAFLGRVSVPELDVDASGNPATKDWSFNWTGYQIDTTAWLVANLAVPTKNYTTGVPASQMASLDGQLYFWGNEDNPYRIWIGGNPGNRFSVSPGTGGGFVDCEPGVGTMVRNVLKFKTQQGAAIVTALCDNVNSQREHRFNLVESNISISNEQSVKGWMAEKIAGTVGCKSPRGALVAGDGLYAVSRYGLAITTLTMEYNSQLQVMYVSDAIAPVFLKQFGHQLDEAVLFGVNGVLYMTFGREDGSLDNIIFCYDIALKAWWTYTLDTDASVLSMIHVDYEGGREGIGVITEDSVFLLPTTMDAPMATPSHDILIESGELSTVQPLQVMHHLTQLEFRFDYFIGDLNIEVTMIDQFGRTITTTKNVHHDELVHQLSEYIRIDAVVESYKIRLTGAARMRLTHFLAKLYPKPARIGLPWGFDSQQSHSSAGSIRRTFNDYNDVRKAIIP